jgi:transposase-like protein
LFLITCKRFACRVEAHEHRIEDVPSVEIDNPRLDSEGEHSGCYLVVGVSLEIRVVILRPLIGAVIQEVLEAEMSEALGAEKGERVEGRLGYRSGYYVRSLITRVGKLELWVPQDRQGRFSSELFERYQRSEKALVGALAEMYIQGVSTRKVKAITEELCGHEFSASSISAINKRLDEELRSFMHRTLEEEFPYLILDARTRSPSSFQ